MWKSGLVWLSRPPDKVLDVRANFGPLRSKISKIGWETPTFYSSPSLKLPIGIQYWPYFGWDISSHFLPWVKISGETGAQHMVISACKERGGQLRSLDQSPKTCKHYLQWHIRSLLQSPIISGSKNNLTVHIRQKPIRFHYSAVQW